MIFLCLIEGFLLALSLQLLNIKTFSFLSISIIIGVAWLIALGRINENIISYFS